MSKEYGICGLSGAKVYTQTTYKVAVMPQMQIAKYANASSRWAREVNGCQKRRKVETQDVNTC